MKTINPGQNLMKEKPLFIGAYPRHAITLSDKKEHLEKLLFNGSIDKDLFVLFANTIKIKEEDIMDVLVKYAIVKNEQSVSFEEVFF